MKNPAEQFLAEAKLLRLTPEEKSAIASSMGIAVREKVFIRHHWGMSAQKFLTAARKVSLTPSERALMKEGLLEAIQATKASLWFLGPFKHLTSVLAAILIIVIASGASVSFAAEKAIPGDVLYPVKIYVNEPARTRLQLSDENRAAFEAKKIMRRLHEAEILAETNRLDDEKIEQIRFLLHQHMDTSLRAMTSMDAGHRANTMTMAQELNRQLRDRNHRLQVMTSRNNTATKPALLISDISNMRMDIEEMRMEDELNRTQDDDGDGIPASAVRIAVPPVPPLPSDQSGQATPQEPSRADRFGLNMTTRVTNDGGSEALDSSEEQLQIDVRLRMAKKRMHMMKNAPVVKSRAMPSVFDDQLRETSIEAAEPMPINMTDVEIRMQGAEQLMDIAKQQMEAGDTKNALHTSDMALRHAERGVRAMQRRK